MKDRHWRDVYQTLHRILTPDDVVLAPRGGWDTFPCQVQQYDFVIEPDKETVLVLHKGRLPAIPKPHLVAVVARWGCVYANDVFVVYARSRPSALEARCGLWLRQLNPVRAYLRSGDRKRRASTIYHVHLPKTGGTSLWACLSKAFRSSVYYGDVHSFLANPPQPDEYDLVGVHFAPALLEGVVGPNDLVVGLMREPTARFLSGVAHCRRQGEDPETFSPSQRAMREMRLVDFLRTEHGLYETRAQLIELGRAPRRRTPPDDKTLLARALAFLDCDWTLLAPSEASDQLLERLEKRLDRSLPRNGRLNANSPADYARYAEEFEEARPAIEALNAGERRLYAEARARFERE